MGCGSSSLKGDKPEGLGGDQPQPIRKVNTNFSTVNYEQDNGNKKRRMTEYAPEETIRNKSEVSTDPGPAGGGIGRPDTAPDNEGPGGEKDVLEPYKSVESPTAAPEMSFPHENLDAGGSSRAPGDAVVNGANGPDPTSAQAKEQFAEANDPAMHNSGLAPEDGSKERKRSWLEKLKDSRKGEISDEEMKKVSD